MNITIKDILEATGGRLIRGREDTVVRHISLDSRKMSGDDLFVPIIGEKTDGHRFIGGAFELGAVAAFTSEHDERSAAEIDQETHAWIRVDDTVAALQALGSWLRGRFTIPFVGVTGSVGKTSTREMIVCALSSQKKVTATAGNSNSQVGVPVTLSLMDPEADVAVMELGMSMPGEMSRIAAVGRPTMAVMTNIGVSHIEQLGSQENILKEKLHIADHIAPGGILLVNGDDPLLRRVKAAASGEKDALPFKVRDDLRVLSYGFGDDCDYRRSDYSFSLRVPGRHNELNALAAIAVCDLLGVDTSAAAGALSAFTGTERRLEFVKLNGFTVIDDSYNASPDSMKAALQVLADTDCAGRRIAVLADMLELGPDSPRYHREIGEYAATLGIDAVYMVGSLIENASAPIEAAGIPVYHYGSNAALASDLVWGLGYGDTVLLKGSNGMHLGEILKELKPLRLDDLP